MRDSLARIIPSGTDPALESARVRLMLSEVAQRHGLLVIDAKRISNIQDLRTVHRLAEQQGIEIGGRR